MVACHSIFNVDAIVQTLFSSSVAMFWLHCNQCLVRASKNKNLVFLAGRCGHILCLNCYEKAPDKCRLCQGSSVVFTKIGDDMPPHMKSNFEDPISILSDVYSANEFQTSQFNLAYSRFRDDSFSLQKELVTAECQITELQDQVRQEKTRNEELESHNKALEVALVETKKKLWEFQHPKSHLWSMTPSSVSSMPQPRQKINHNQLGDETFNQTTNMTEGDHDNSVSQCDYTAIESDRPENQNNQNFPFIRDQKSRNIAANHRDKIGFSPLASSTPFNLNHKTSPPQVDNDLDQTSTNNTYKGDYTILEKTPVQATNKIFHNPQDRNLKITENLKARNHKIPTNGEDERGFSLNTNSRALNFNNKIKPRIDTDDPNQTTTNTEPDFNRSEVLGDYTLLEKIPRLPPQKKFTNPRDLEARGHKIPTSSGDERGHRQQNNNDPMTTPRNDNNTEYLGDYNILSKAPRNQNNKIQNQRITDLVPSSRGNEGDFRWPNSLTSLNSNWPKSTQIANNDDHNQTTTNTEPDFNRSEVLGDYTLLEKTPRLPPQKKFTNPRDLEVCGHKIPTSSGDERGYRQQNNFNNDPMTTPRNDNNTEYLGDYTILSKAPRNQNNKILQIPRGNNQKIAGEAEGYSRKIPNEKLYHQTSYNKEQDLDNDVPKGDAANVPAKIAKKLNNPMFPFLRDQNQKKTEDLHHKIPTNRGGPKREFSWKNNSIKLNFSRLPSLEFSPVKAPAIFKLNRPNRPK